MKADFSGRWTMNPRSDPFLPGIEAGMVVLKIEHIDPLLQVTLTHSAPGYALGAFVLNCRTDHVEVLTSRHGIQARTDAYWDTGNQLLVDMSICMGSYERHFRSSWSLSTAGKSLTIRHIAGDPAGPNAIFQRRDLPYAG
ncbi:MAG TPA: hypothetical protein VGL89_02790 [Candidatus Koribacter sp.]|jgi:hypothetical protein